MDSSYLGAISPKPSEPINHQQRKNSSDEEKEEEQVIKREDNGTAVPVKVPKKPGRKPINENEEAMPPTKRKAQNRAAQRAFRERKEQHLKDLETRVAELTQTTEKDKQVNGLLRTQIARLETELRGYKERSALISTSRARPSLEPTNYPAAAAVFGSELGNVYSSTLPSAQSDKAAAPLQQGTGHSSRNRTPASERAASNDPCLTHGNSPANSLTQSPIGVDTVSELFPSAGLNPVGYKLDGSNAASPQEVRKQSQHSWSLDDGTDSNGGISRVFRFNSESGSTMSHADSSSSLSQFNVNSSCDTSPESNPEDSPPKVPGSAFTKPQQHSFSTVAPGTDLNWLVEQNKGQFDPMLFGDYRESQDAIIGDGDFNNGLFNDALLYDTSSPLNLDGLFTPTAEVQQSFIQPAAPSQALLRQVDAQQDGILDPSITSDSRITLGDPYFEKIMQCSELKNKLESSGFKNGKFDLDNLCDELKSKAKCNGHGPTWTKGQLDEHFERLAAKPT